MRTQAQSKETILCRLDKENMQSGEMREGQGWGAGEGKESCKFM